MSIVRLIVKQEMVLNLIYLFLNYNIPIARKNATFRTTVQMSYIMVLYIK